MSRTQSVSAPPRYEDHCSALPDAAIRAMKPSHIPPSVGWNPLADGKLVEAVAPVT